MTDAKKKPERKPGENTVSTPKFLLGAAVIVGVVVAVVVLALRFAGDERDAMNEALAERYTNTIEVRSVPRGGGSYTDLVYIDGTPRYDCDVVDNERLECSDDPQPTER